MESIKEQLITWKNNLLAPNKNDVLLQTIPGKNALSIEKEYDEEKAFEVVENSLLKKLFRDYESHLKETGSPIFGLAQDLLLFQIDGQTYQLPFFLASASIHRNRLNGNFILEQVEDFYINPLLLNLTEIEDLPENIEKTVELLKERGLEIEIQHGIWGANFHPHRFVLQKEFDELLECKEIRPSLKSLLGEEKNSFRLELNNHFLFPADESQREAINSIVSEDIVIQGPPGTGKSQVITNLMGKILGERKNALLVAEKSVALQVIYDKLKEKDLHHFCALYHHELKSKQFVKSLESTWHFLEELLQKPITVSEQSTLLSQQIDFTLARLRQSDLIGNTSLMEFLAEYQPQDEGKYIFQKPTIPQWKEDKEKINSLKAKGFSLFSSWRKIKLNIDLQNSHQYLERCIALAEEIIPKEWCIQELRKRLKISNYLSLFYYNDAPINREVFERNSKTQKAFKKHYNALKTLFEQRELLKKEEEHWTREFSLSELEEYIKILTSNKLSYSHWKAKKNLSKLTSLNMEEGLKTLQNLKELYAIKQKIIRERELLRGLDLPDELPLLEHIQYTIERLNSADENDLQLLFSLTEKERQDLRKSNTQLQNFYDLQKTYFDLEESEPILSQLLEIKKEYPQVIAHSSSLRDISKETKRALLQHCNLKELEASIYYSHWIDFKGQYPQLAELKGQDLMDKVEKQMIASDKETEEYISFIQQEIKNRFEFYHELLQTPSRKLKDEEKEWKKELRIGKSILVKAFSKKRVFPTVRELLNSEAKHWITLLHPLFLCSPYSVAKSIPLSHSFDLVIFDEASQIPLSHAIGSVQRGKRIAICGDQQQMAPQFYFQKKNQQESDVLHHASYYWKNSMLTHHYRSLYPELIAFSNQYFYENKLKTFPIPQTNKAIECITLEGVFNERKNEKEAQKVAEILLQKVKNKEFDFGLVAFSQTQLDCILEKIPMDIQEKIYQQDSIFIQSLENVQGDQCRHLLISMGYGKDIEGEFHKRFGPLNQEQGHRRLNVLMSRAIEKITFIRSVTSQDFSISDNEGVELLRKLMLFLERSEGKETKLLFPEGVTYDGQTIHIPNPAHTFHNGQALVDFYRTSQKRGWKF